MKILYSIIGIIMLIFLALLGWKFYAESHTESATVRDLAKFNPLISSKKYYVKTEEPKKVKKLEDNFYNYTYKSKAYNKEGKSKIIKYTATKKLKKDHYLALEYKVGEVRNYKEVSSSKIPKKAFHKLK